MWFIAVLSLLLPGVGRCSCLQDAVPASQRRLLRVNENGTEVGRPLLVGGIPFDTPLEVGAILMGIIVEEVLGLQMTITRPPDVSSAARMTAGCTDLRDRAPCPPELRGPRGLDVATFMWEVDTAGNYELAEDVLSKTYMGFQGEEAVALHPSTVSSILKDRVGNPLHWLSWKETEWAPAFRPYLSNLTEIDEVVKKLDVPLGDFTYGVLHDVGVATAKYTGDEEAVELIDGVAFAKRDANGWWKTKLCREEGKCTPVITMGGFSAPALFQMSYKRGIGLAFLDVRDKLDVLPTVIKAWFATFYPSDFVLSFEGEMISFPKPNLGEQAKLNYDSLMAGQDTVSLVHKGVEAEDLRLWRFLHSLQLLDTDVVDLLREALGERKKHPDQGGGWREVLPTAVCRWMLVNEARWRPMVPPVGVCPVGQGLLESGAGECAWCQAGERSATVNEEDRCLACAPGTISTLPGRTECDKCGVGKYSSEAGSDRCSKCRIGEYGAVEGAPTCTVCPYNQTTLTTGSDSVAACGCPAETYADIQQAEGKTVTRCLPCPSGMSCDFGAWLRLNNGIPWTRGIRPLPNHMSLAAAPLEAFACVDRVSCPASAKLLPGECAAGRLGAMCAFCPDKQYPSDTGCSECEGGSMALMPLALVGMVVACQLVYTFANSAITGRATQALMLSCNMGVLMTFMQTLGVATAFTITWPPAMSWLMDLSALLLLQVDVLHPVCYVGSSYAVEYASSLLLGVAPPLTFAALFLLRSALAVLASGAPGAMQIRMDLDMLLNSIGTVTQMLYIALCKSALSYLECRGHPSAPDTALSSPGVLCGSEEHTDALPLAVVAIVVYPVGIFSYFAYINLIAPSRYEDATFRVRYRFLLYRWRPDRWYWGLVCQVRNLCISLVTVVSSVTAIQLALSQLLLLGFGFATTSCQPWRAIVNNRVDMGMTIGLVVLLGFANGLGTTEAGEVAEAGVVAAALGVVVLLLFVMLQALFEGTPRRAAQQQQRLSLENEKFLRGLFVVVEYMAAEDRGQLTAELSTYLISMNDAERLRLLHSIGLLAVECLGTDYTTRVRNRLTVSKGKRDSAGVVKRSSGSQVGSRSVQSMERCGEEKESAAM